MLWNVIVGVIPALLKGGGSMLPRKLNPVNLPVEEVRADMLRPASH